MRACMCLCVSECVCECVCACVCVGGYIRVCVGTCVCVGTRVMENNLYNGIPGDLNGQICFTLKTMAAALCSALGHLL